MTPSHPHHPHPPPNHSRPHCRKCGRERTKHDFRSSDNEGDNSICRFCVQKDKRKIDRKAAKALERKRARARARLVTKSATVVTGSATGPNTDSMTHGKKQ